MQIGVGIGLGNRRGALAAIVNPLLTIGGETLVGAGARAVGAANGVYGPYTVAAGLMSPNTTPVTPGTYNVGGVTITTEASVIDVGTGELQAVVALGSAALTGRTIKVLPNADALGISVLSTPFIFPATITLASPLTITSRDRANQGYCRSMEFKHVGAVYMSFIKARDGWATNMATFTPIMGLSGAVSPCSLHFDSVEVSGPAASEAQMTPTSQTTIVAGYYYKVRSALVADWSAIGGPANVDVPTTEPLGINFTASVTNANISAYGTVYLMPQVRRGIGISGYTPGVTYDVSVKNCYIHDVEYGIIGSATAWDIQRNKLDVVLGDFMQISPTGLETKLDIIDNVFLKTNNYIGTPLGNHSDGLQMLLLDMATNNAVQYRILGNRSWPAGPTNGEPYQMLFASNPQATPKQLNVLFQHNLLMGAQGQGLASASGSALSDMSYNTIVFDTRYTVGPDANVPKIGAYLEIGGMAVHENIHSGLSYTSGDAPLTFAKTFDNYQFATFNNAGMSPVLAAADYSSNAFASLAAFTAGLQLKAGSPALASYGPNPGAGAYYAWDATPAPAYSASGIGTGLASVPAAIVPAAFTVGMWTCADLGAGVGLAVAMSSKPRSGGAVTTAIQYKIGTGAWVSSGGVADFTIPGASLTMGAANDICIRAINSAGSAADSDLKTRTPTNVYLAQGVEFPASVYMVKGSETVTGAKQILVSFSFMIPTTWPNNNSAFLAAPHSEVWARYEATRKMTMKYYTTLDVQIGATLSTPDSTLQLGQWYTFVYALRTTIADKRSIGYYRKTGDADWTLIDDTTPVLSEQVIADITTYYLGDNGAVVANYADFYVAMGQYMDISVKANRDKFLPSVSKGVTGATPTGTQPTYFFSGTVGAWNVNKGSAGGTATVAGGSLAAAASNPT